MTLKTKTHCTTEQHDNLSIIKDSFLFDVFSGISDPNLSSIACKQFSISIHINNATCKSKNLVKKATCWPPCCPECKHSIDKSSLARIRPRSWSRIKKNPEYMENIDLLSHQILRKYPQRHLKWNVKAFKRPRIMHGNYTLHSTSRLPSLSTIGKADTLYSANVLRAVMTGVSGLI